MRAVTSELPNSKLAGQPDPAPEFLALVLESRTFEKSPTLRALLAYLWNHRDLAVNEYGIATEALGRSPNFDPKFDATVRVQISRLRQRLERFYESEGKACTLQLTIPVGTHQVLLKQLAASPIPEIIVDEPEPVKPSNRVAVALFAACLFLAAVSAVLAIQLGRVNSRQPAKSPPIPEFWNTFFADGRPTRIVLPTPIFFSFKNGLIMFRNTEVNQFATSEPTGQFQALKNALGTPELAQNYTVTSDTFASVNLARYFDSAGLPTTVLSSADAPIAALDHENVVALGTWGTLMPFKSYLDRMTFQMQGHEQHVVNLRPQKGEPKESVVVNESTQPTNRAIWPGVIALLPGNGGRTHLLILVSRHTSALVSFLTSSKGLEDLHTIWQANGSPEYYEVLVSAEMDGNSLVRFWPVALHPFR